MGKWVSGPRFLVWVSLRCERLNLSWIYFSDEIALIFAVKIVQNETEYIQNYSEYRSSYLLGEKSDPVNIKLNILITGHFRTLCAPIGYKAIFILRLCDFCNQRAKLPL